MVFPEGHYPLGPRNGHVHVRTTRSGLASRAGHDLLLAVESWAGGLTVGPQGVRLELELAMASLHVVATTAGVRPLTAADRRTIDRNAHRTLQVGSFPTARFTAAGTPSLERGGVLHGALTLRGWTAPVALLVATRRSGGWEAVATLRQTAFGVEPFSGLFGAMRVADLVTVEAQVALDAS